MAMLNNQRVSLDWFKGTFTGQPHIWMAKTCKKTKEFPVQSFPETNPRDLPTVLVGIYLFFFGIEIIVWGFKGILMYTSWCRLVT